jgi:hypothetical protein
MKTKLITLIIILSFASVYSYTQSERKYISSLELDPVNTVGQKDLFSLKLSDIVRRGDKLYKLVEIEK